MDPDMFEAYQNIYEYAFLDGKQLPAKYRELIAMAILAYRGSREGVIAHAKRAYLLGATKTEILDAAITTLIPGGAPTFNAYIAVLRELD
jgi:AhpD family alkylhydroperoxidase